MRTSTQVAMVSLIVSVLGHEACADPMKTIREMLEGRCDNMTIYLMDWQTLTRQKISPSELIERADYKMQVHAPKLDSAKVHRLVQPIPMKADSPDVRVGVILTFGRAKTLKLFFGHSLDRMIMDGRVVSLDKALIQLFWDYFPCIEKQKIERALAVPVNRVDPH
jgi:hypothetical protein